MALRSQAALLLNLRLIVTARFGEHITAELSSIGQSTSQRLVDRRLDIAARLRCKPCPLRLGQDAGNQVPMQLTERITRALEGDDFGRLVRLRILSRVARKARHRQTQQYRNVAVAHERDSSLRKLRRLRRIGAVTFEDGQPRKRPQVSRYVATRGLQV